MQQLNTEILEATLRNGVFNKGKAIVLFSGGLDSTTVLYKALSDGYDVYPISFNYKQRHAIELQFAAKTLEKIGIDLGVNLKKRWKVFNLDFSGIEHSALIDLSMSIPKDRPIDDMDKGVPSSYVPMRNTIFLAYAAAYADTIFASHIFIGVNCLDYSGYPDCRPEFIKSILKTLTLGSRYADDEKGRDAFCIHAPLMELNKAQIIKLGISLGVDYSLTWSCYDPKITQGQIVPCKVCDSCILRMNGFRESNIGLAYI